MELRSDSGANDLEQEMISHFFRTIGEIETVDEPFQHFYAENALPDRVYEKLLASLPSEDSYGAFNPKRYKNSQGKPTRGTIELDRDGINAIEPQKQPFWQDITAVLQSEVFRKFVFGKLTDDLCLRLDCLPDELDSQFIESGCLLVRDVDEYGIKPHPDGHPRVVTMMFYLPKDFSQETLGTSLYVENDLLSRLRGHRFREFKRFPFRPNSVCAFAVNDTPKRRSLHGREKLPSGSGVRHSLLVSWRSEKTDESKHAAKFKSA